MRDPSKQPDPQEPFSAKRGPSAAASSQSIIFLFLVSPAKVI